MLMPVSAGEMRGRGWEGYDFLLVSADAYVDHPSFGHAVIGRVLEAKGYRVAMLAQPRWDTTADFVAMGRPRLATLISCGAVDSMVNLYTAAKRRRSGDAYAPGGKAGHRPSRAAITYSNRAREAFGGCPIILGGAEPSLRRFSHYDYWDGKVRRSILADSGADMAIYGMGELAVLEVAGLLAAGDPIASIRDVRGTCVPVPEGEFRSLVRSGGEGVIKAMPDHWDVTDDKAKYAKAFAMQYRETDPYNGCRLAQKVGDTYIVQNMPRMPMTEGEMDWVYGLPYERRWHPSYDAEGGVPALSEVEFGIVSHRGCFGGCSFCSINFMQGRYVQKRSEGSIIAEGRMLTAKPGFKGYISDVGGPTANFREPPCDRAKGLTEGGMCRDRRCLFPKVCPEAKADHSEYLRILRKLRELPGVRKAFIRSGVRYDYLMHDKAARAVLTEICAHHVSGQMKVAPEHVSRGVLRQMGKPGREAFDRFSEMYRKVNAGLGKEQYLVPYLMSGHPGSAAEDAEELAAYLAANGVRAEQVQEFYPTPGTLSTCMYHTGINPLTGEGVYAAKDRAEKDYQRGLLQPHKASGARCAGGPGARSAFKPGAKGVAKHPSSPKARRMK